jgi:hypothetical protein
VLSSSDRVGATATMAVSGPGRGISRGVCVGIIRPVGVCVVRSISNRQEGGAERALL